MNSLLTIIAVWLNAYQRQQNNVQLTRSVVEVQFNALITIPSTGYIIPFVRTYRFVWFCCSRGHEYGESVDTVI